MKNQRSLGSLQEDMAARFLRQRGYVILEQQFFNPFGEIDLIYLKGQILAFGEVKYRSSTAYGQPAEAVNLRKQQKILRGAQYYLLKHPEYQDPSRILRFDVIELLKIQDKEYIRVIEDAFRPF